MAAAPEEYPGLGFDLDGLIDVWSLSLRSRSRP